MLVDTLFSFCLSKNNEILKKVCDKRKIKRLTYIPTTSLQVNKYWKVGNTVTKRGIFVCLVIAFENLEGKMVFVE